MMPTKERGMISICQGRKKRMVSKQGIWSQHTAHNNQQQEKKDNSFDLRICVIQEERKKARQQGNDSICEGRKKEW
jgi:hypothetical protein